MGISKLHQFMEEENKLQSNYELSNTQIIIDGCSLLYDLYYAVSSSFHFGGDYTKYYDHAKMYFEKLLTAFEECKIEPIIVFDGGHFSSDYQKIELSRLEKKQENKIKTIAKILKGKSQEKISAINLHECFKNMISELTTTSSITIKLVQCDYGGDKMIAALAKSYNCPILSNDSDYYIYDLPAGYIRTSHINFDVICNNGKKYLNCKIYKADFLLEEKDRYILPLFGVLALNDYTEFDNFANFFEELKILNKWPFKENMFKRFKELLKWLPQRSLEEAKNKVLSSINEDKKLNEETKIAVKQTIDFCIDNYDLKDSNFSERIKNILKILYGDSKINISEGTQLRYPCGQSLPKTFVESFHKGNIPSTLYNVISAHRIILSPQIEDFQLKSSYSISRHIRQVTYSILLNHVSNSDKEENHKKECFCEIKERDGSVKKLPRNVLEYDRENEKLVYKEITVLTRLKNGDPVPSLADIYGMEKNALRTMIANVLEVDNAFFNGIPEHLQLLFACIQYWISKCVPSTELVTSLLLCIVYFQSKIKDSEVNMSPNGSDYLRLAETDINKVNQIDIRIIHSYSQLETCVQASVGLNLLTNLPFHPPALHESLCGTMLYNLTMKLKQLKTSKRIEEHINDLLGKETTAKELFHKFKIIFKV